MSLKPKLLTKTNVMEVFCPADKQRVIQWDTKLVGLGVSATSKKIKAENGELKLIQNRRYIFNFRLHGKETRVTLPKVSEFNNPSKMREMAEDILRRAILGEEFRPKIRKRLEQEKRTRESVTVGNVMEAYSDWMIRTEKQSANAVKNQFEKNIRLKFPKLWNKPARQFTPMDAKTIIDARSILSLHEANKLRSYMRTAYQMAIEAVATTDDVREFLNLGLDYKFSNPVIQKAPKAIRTDRKRRVTIDQIKMELQTYWAILDSGELPEVTVLLLKLHLLTGGQRPAQLARIQSEDIEIEGQKPHIRLIRTKGRSAPKDRDHIVPLTKTSGQLIESRKDASYPFSLTGANQMLPSQFSRLYKTYIADKMLSSGLSKKDEPFSLSAIRKSSTTYFRQSFPWYLEALLNDHGRTADIQTDFYDQNDYYQEKLDALRSWENFIFN